MGPIDVVLAPWRAVRVLARAAEDLNAVAERARRDPDPVDEAWERLDALFNELETLIVAIRTVDASAVALGAGGEDLLQATRSLNSTARAIETGGRELRRTGEELDGHTQELIAGGGDLTAVAKDLAGSLRVLRAALPRLLEGLASVEQLEESVDTVAETVEPLQGVAKGVGRVSDRLSRRS
jgi:ABC-type transporter Mla subunit MlaD